MRPLKRPSEAAKTRWAGLTRTTNAIKKVNQAIATKTAQKLESDDFPNAWADPIWKQALSDAQDGLCAWCTRKPVEGGSPGQVDHLRPKSEVRRDVEIETEGNGKRIRHYLPKDGLRPGYYWLAYHPDNLAFVCDQCNGRKRTFWPVQPWRDPNQWKAPTNPLLEWELILDPFDGAFDPLAHFQFEETGNILPIPGDESAEATILMAGLDEEDVAASRRDVYRKLQRWLGTLVRLLRTNQVVSDEASIVQDVAQVCDWVSPHAAFSRAALHDLLRNKGYSWPQWEDLCQRYGVAMTAAEPPAGAWLC